MNVSFFSLLLAGQQTADAGGGSQNFLVTLLPFAAIIAIFYFLIIRPQNKKQKETQKMLSALKKGDRVVTVGGIHGTVQSVREGSVILKIDDNVKVEFNRNAISSVESAAREEKEEKKEDEGPRQSGAEGSGN
ncbi:MAG: preprotein translocase subunit YajC [Treponema sp.]|jgi:preprotein translocase subunit YajC|nr:preprotein translocase subunit YajC [Treponema sp.]